MGVFVNTLIISTFPAKLYTTYPGEFQPAEASVGDVRIKLNLKFESNEFVTIHKQRGEERLERLEEGFEVTALICLYK